MKKRICSFLVLPFVLFACSDSSDTPAGGGPVDTSTPSIAGVVAVDANQIQIAFSEQVKKETAEQQDHYLIIETAPTMVAGVTPGDTIHVATAVLGSDGTTVTLSTWNQMGILPYMLSVTGVEDLSGNKITTPVSTTFTGTDASDVTPPELVARTPVPNATGVGIGTSVTIQFSEPMNFSTVQQAFQWSSGAGAVPWEMNQENDNKFVFRPLSALLNNTLYTLTLQGTAQDWAGNGLSGGTMMWTFRTTSQVDNTPPTLVSSVPANGATNVSVSSNIQMTFSEAIDQNSLQDVFVSPEPGNGVETWSNGGRTVTFNPDVDLMDDTQYTLLIIPGGVRDLAGNGNTTAYQFSWSTGSTLASGRFSGVISGDPTSTAASNPAGALVIAADSNPFGDNDDFGIAGSGVVGSNGSYSVNNLPDGWYYPLAAMDSNGDGEIDPDKGDAFGFFGVSFGVDNTPDSVQIAGGNTVSGVNFALFDPHAIVGTVSYAGSMPEQYGYFVGAFDTTGFDVNNVPDPDYGTEGFWPFDPAYTIDEFDEGLTAGTYYVGAYLDINGDTMFDPATEPAGFYGGATPTPITLAGGEDALNINIVMVDPTPGIRASAVSWGETASTREAWLTDAAARIKRLLAQR